jgi:hypothetical protein
LTGSLCIEFSVWIHNQFVFVLELGVSVFSSTRGEKLLCDEIERMLEIFERFDSSHIVHVHAKDVLLLVRSWYDVLFELLTPGSSVAEWLRSLTSKHLPLTAVLSNPAAKFDLFFMRGSYIQLEYNQMGRQPFNRRQPYQYIHVGAENTIDRWYKYSSIFNISQLCSSKSMLWINSQHQKENANKFLAMCKLYFT